MDYEHKLGKRYSFAVRDPRTGKSVYYCHLEEALCAVFEAREKSPLPAPAFRLFPLGEGVKGLGHIVGKSCTAVNGTKTVTPCTTHW